MSWQVSGPPRAHAAMLPARAKSTSAPRSTDAARLRLRSRSANEASRLDMHRAYPGSHPV